MLPALLTAAGTGLQVYSQLKGASAERKAADQRAAALNKQAQRRLAQGQAQSEAIKSQGKMDQTTYAGRTLSSGIDRESLAMDSSLSEIANRAQNESIVALQNAQYDAQSIQDDISALQQNAKANQEAAYIGAAGSILGSVYDYNKTNWAAKAALNRGY